MNNHDVPQILAKASNCFYLLLDSESTVITANKHFLDLWNSQISFSGKPFPTLFTSEYAEQWQTALDNILTSQESVQTLAAPFNTGAETLHVSWTICGIFNTDKVINSFEILGIPVEKQFEINDSGKQDSKLKSVFYKLRKILDSSLDIICAVDENGKFTKISAACKTILGYEPKEMVGKSFFDFVHKDDLERTKHTNLEIKKGFNTTNFENRFYKKDGTSAPLIWSSKWEEADKRFYCTARDASEKEANEAALKASEEKYRVLFYNHPLPMWIYDTKTFKFLEVNEATIELLGYSRSEFMNMSIKTFLEAKEVKKFENLYKEESYYTQNHKGLWVHKKKNNEKIVLEIISNAIGFEKKNAKIVLGIDRTEKIKAEEELLKSNEKYLFLSRATFDATWDWDLTTGKVEWNEGVKKMFDIPDPEDINSKNWWYNNLHDEDRERVITRLNEHTNKHLPDWEDEYRFKNGNSEYIYVYHRAYTIYDQDKKAVRMIGAMQDLTERKTHENTLKKLNTSLEKRAQELAESNAELERFAYVASHDLQEPLRMVTSFLQLLEKRYKDKLDQKANEYIRYAVDGAERMKKLILDLLEYSRVNSSKNEKEDVDLNEVISNLKHTYQNILEESKGTINNEILPVVKGNKTQLLQLFQNIIGNAFKYKSEKAPKINIACIEDNKQFEFSITDNGIGIDHRFFNKIFIIFQRLHNREQYSGTGIGLAICKKIIDKHGGKIWVNSQLEQGSTFYFTLPKPR